VPIEERRQVDRQQGDQEPRQDRHPMMVEAVTSMVGSCELIEGVVFNPPTPMAHLPEDSQRQGLQPRRRHPAPVALFELVLPVDPTPPPLRPALLRLIFPHLGAGFRGRRNRRNSLAGAAWPGVAQAPPVRFS
jgi:hypothetical protein